MCRCVYVCVCVCVCARAYAPVCVPAFVCVQYVCLFQGYFKVVCKQDRGNSLEAKLEEASYYQVIERTAEH